ncbi:AbrB family transcriptional regulator [Sporosarcina sp. FSL W7-1349]|uniref:AbrB family transcriptional regulator n=1 Tax=Sporosarcina sp. FSL W7-1349 TaxID=2921561 RepID=UPI0030F880ED
MVIQKSIYLVAAVFVGFLFNMLNIPAGWLIGSILTGIICGVFITRFQFHRNLFKLVLAFVGANISLLIHIDSLKLISHLFLPLLATILVLIATGYLLGLLLHKKTNIDRNTAFFCCIPGGASEIIGISGQYGADDRLVAAFHTIRITFFTISIPLLIGYFHPITVEPTVQHSITLLSPSQILFFLIVILITLFLDKKLKFPGGTLIFSIVTGFLLTTLFMEIEPVPRTTSGIGQALIGAFVGIRFDREVLKSVWKVGPTTVLIISTLFCITLGTSFIFMLITGLPYATSLISTVPAGAAEMTVTAVALEVNPTIVASLHIIRVITLFLLLSFLLKFLKIKTSNEV